MEDTSRFDQCRRTPLYLEQVRLRVSYALSYLISPILYLERVAGGGGILLLVDQAPEEPEEIIEPEVPTMPVVAAASTEPIAMAVDQTAPHIALGDGPEADPPVSFEVCSFPG